MKVIFFDEAQKLWVIYEIDSIKRAYHFLHLSRPACIQSAEMMKCLLDSMLVLMRQDQLCRVIHAMSNLFIRHIRKKGFGPEETQVALGVSRDSKDIKD